VDGDWLTAAQFAFTVGLIVTVALLMDVWLSPTVPGAGDNASGVAVALRLADRLGAALEHFRVDVVLTGAQESMSDGMRSFLRRHREHLPRDRTVILILDEVGAGAVRYTVREGPLVAVRSHRQLVDLSREIAADLGDPAPRPLDNRAPSDGFRSAYAGYPSLTVTCRDELGLAPRHHRRSDLPEHVDPAAIAAAEELCVELARRLDALVGPELDSG
jgi:Zn-dependent M28 family amino/carboxypeptidase